jgi:hippurate hydrolase
LLAAGAVHAQQDAAAVINSIYPQLDAIYKDLHAHPEIAFEEVRTAAKLAAEMRKIGFEVTEKVGKTGVVAIYKNGPGPLVLVRTEMDALPMEEKSGLPYASKVPLPTAAATTST